MSIRNYIKNNIATITLSMMALNGSTYVTEDIIEAYRAEQKRNQAEFKAAKFSSKNQRAVA